MSKFCTDIEQSRRLIGLGLKHDSADMYYEPSPGFRTEPSDIKAGEVKYAHPRSIPAWSLAALLEMFPAINVVTFKRRFRCEYIDNEWSNGPDYTTEYYDNVIDAVVEMVGWLIENGYIKTQQKQ